MSDVKGKTGAVLRETAVLTGAVAIIAAGVLFFLVPSHTSVTSIYGLGIVLSNFVPLPLSVITMILNVVLLIIGFFTCGREFGAKTVYTSVLLPVFLGLFEKLFPEFGSMTGSQELDVLCYILVVSIGLSILFNRNASSGGLDIVAKIMNKYLHMELGKAMSLSGMCVALSAALVYDKKTVVLSILGTYFNGIVLDHFIFDNSIKRRVCIITKKEEEREINDLLAMMELPEEIKLRKAHELSGGQQKRVCIARAWAAQPDVLIFDEAVSGLDVLVRKHILDLLKRLHQERKMTCFFITHDLDVALYLADRVMVMRCGKIIEDRTFHGSTDCFTHPYTKLLLHSIAPYLG